MKLRTTHTLAELELSRAAYDEIAAKLREAGYDHAFSNQVEPGLPPAIDMSGIQVIAELAPKPTVPSKPPAARVARVQEYAGLTADPEKLDTTIEARGQQKQYLVLSDEERAKGFVRPVRKSYVHVGKPKPSNLRDLTEEELLKYTSYGYVKFESFPAGKGATGRFWTQAQLDRIEKGCGAVTSMALPIAETYAREPMFYGGTYCSTCHAHFPVGKDGEFVWEGTDERVGT